MPGVGNANPDASAPSGAARNAPTMPPQKRSVAADPPLQGGQLVLQLDLGATIRAVPRHVHVDGHDAQRMLALREIEQCGAVQIGRCELTMDHGWLSSVDD